MALITSSTHGIVSALSLIALLVTACAPEPGHTAPERGDPPMARAADPAPLTTVDGLPVARWTVLSPPGIELYVVQHDHRPFGVARTPDGVLRGFEAFRAVTGGLPDASAADLARLAMLLLDTGVAGAPVWTAAKPFGPPDQRTRAADPAVVSERLVYFRRHVQAADLVRCALDPRSGALECASLPELAHAQAVSTDPLAAAKTDLANDNLSIRKRGLVTLVNAGTPEALALVIAAAADPLPRVRAVAVQTLASADHANATAALIGALDDADPAVRRAAVLGLRGRRTPAVGAALRRVAASDADPSVKALATASAHGMP